MKAKLDIGRLTTAGRGAAFALGVAAMLALSAGAALAASPCTLLGDGLSCKSQKLPFGKPGQAAISAITAALGKPLRSHTVPDCGQGDPMTLVEFKGGLTLQFLKGRFSGWSLDEPADAGLKTGEGIAIGASRAAVLKAYPDAYVDDGSLGVMFTREDGPSGFLDSDAPNARVTGLYAGETCMIS